MRIWYADQIHPAVKSAVKSKICMLWVNVGLMLIAAVYCQKVLTLFFADISDIRTECRISSFMISYLFAIYIYNSLLTCCRKFHKNPAACKWLLWSLKSLGIPVTASVICTVSVIAIYCIPGMWKIHILSVCRKSLRKTCVFLDKFPPLVQINNITHPLSPVFFIYYLCSISTYSRLPEILLYAGRMILSTLINSSMRCALQPEILAIAKIGVNSSRGIPSML